MNFFMNVIWSMGGNFVVQLLGLITNIFLARMLGPEYFGIVGIAMVFIVLIFTLQEAGFSYFIVQRKIIDKSLISTTFYLNIIFSVMLGIILWFVASYIALFYSQPEIAKIIQFSLIAIFLGSFGITYRGLLLREKQFKKLMIIDIITEVVGIILTILFVFQKFYLLAIGIRIIARPAIQAILLFFLSGIRDIIAKPDFKLLPQIIPFSMNILGIRVFGYLRNNIDYLLVGRLLGSHVLGLYTLAFQWSTISKFYISGSISKVLFPEISRNQDNLNRVTEIFLDIVKKSTFITFPFCIGLALIAPEFIEVVYGDKWLDSILILQILMVTGSIVSFEPLIGAVFQGLGKPNREFNITIISIIFFMPFIYIGSLFGIIGVSFSVLIHAFLFTSILIITMLKLLKISYGKFYKAFAPNLYSILTMVVLYYLIKPIIFSENIVKLIFLVLLEIVLYSLTSLIFNREILAGVMKKLNQ